MIPTPKSGWFRALTWSTVPVESNVENSHHDVPGGATPTSAFHGETARDAAAIPIVARMDELFAVDAEARRKTLTTAERHIRRQETAKPLLDEIRSKIDVA
jgi:hypothetical protein